MAILLNKNSFTIVQAKTIFPPRKTSMSCYPMWCIEQGCYYYLAKSAEQKKHTCLHLVVLTLIILMIIDIYCLCLHFSFFSAKNGRLTKNILDYIILAVNIVWWVFPWCQSCRQVTGPEFLCQLDTIFPPTLLLWTGTRILHSMLCWVSVSRCSLGKHQTLTYIESSKCWAVVLPSTKQIVP